MTRLKRKDALILMRTAGYHDDAREFYRLKRESRISYRFADEEWARGVGMRQAGVPCACIDCKKP